MTSSTEGGAGGPTPPGWYADPAGSPALRWWDGTAWTEHLSQPAVSAAADDADDPLLRWLVPVGRSGWAVAAGYAGLFALLVLPAPLALLLSVVALHDLRRRPGRRGRGRAVFGLVMGALGSIVLAAVLVAGVS